MTWVKNEEDEDLVRGVSAHALHTCYLQHTPLETGLIGRDVAVIVTRKDHLCMWVPNTRTQETPEKQMEEKKKENNKSTENLRLRESEGTEQDLRGHEGRRPSRTWSGLEMKAMAAEKRQTLMRIWLLCSPAWVPWPCERNSMNRGAEIHRAVIKKALTGHFPATGMWNIKTSRAPCRILVDLLLVQDIPF